MNDKAFAQTFSFLLDLEIPEAVIRSQWEELLADGTDQLPNAPVILMASTVQSFIEAERSPEKRRFIRDWPGLDGVPSRMKGDWRPKMQTTQELARLSGRSTTEVWELRNQFVAEAQREQRLSKFWNVEFVNYVLMTWWHLFLAPTEASTANQESFELSHHAEAAATLWGIVKGLREGFRPQYRRISKGWQPTLYTAKILEKRGVPRRYTYHSWFVSGFINRVEQGHIPANNLQNRYITHIEGDIPKVAGCMPE